MTVVPNAYILEKTARLSGLSAGQLREWAKSGFFQPHFESGLYSLRDIISLRTLGILRNERGISLQSLKKFKKWLDQRYDQPWSELRFATYGSEVLLDADGRLISGKKPGQYADVVPFPMERVELTIDVRDDFPVSGPVANTPDGWLTMALNTDLNIAALEALGAMVDLMAALLKVDRKTALGLAGTAVDLRITQIANRVNGVHALLPHGAIR